MKNIRITFVLLSLVFLLPRQAAAASTINNSLNVQTQSNLRIVATSTPTPTQTPVRTQINTNMRVVASPAPTTAHTILPVKALTNIADVPIFTQIVSPNGGEEITIGDTTSEVHFTYGGKFDMSVGGNYHYRLELWRSGQLLGNVDDFDMYPLNPYQSSVYFNWKPGQYFQKNIESGTESLKTADAGPGYSLRIVISLGYADPGSGVTKYKDIAEDVSDGTFTFLPKLKTLKVFVPESYSVNVKYPNGGEYLPLKERVDMVFDYKGTFDQEQGGTYNYRIELWQNGVRLGTVHALDDYQLDTNNTQVTYGLTPEYYFAQEGNTAKTVKIIPGSGYRLKVVLMQAYTPEGGSETLQRELASDMSDKPFSISPALSNPLVDGFKTITTPINSFFSWLGGLLKPGSGKGVNQ